MAAAAYNFSVEKGTTFQKQITWKDTVGNPVNLAGYTVTVSLRAHAGGDVLLSLTDTNGGIIKNNPQGQMTLYMTPTVTAAFTERKYYYTLDISNGTDITRIMKGKIAVVIG